MEYDPIKRQLGTVFNRTPLLRKLFYALLDLLLLRAWHVHKALKSLRRAGGSEHLSILDAGSGFGQYSYRMSRLFPKASIKGVDVKEEQIDDCNRFFGRLGLAHRVSFSVGDLTAMTDTDRYDVILSVDVMEHIEPDEQVFAHFFRALRPSGMLLISTPSDQGGSDTHSHDPSESHGFIDEHVRDGYNIEEITLKLKRAGFQTVEAAYTYGRLGSFSWRLSMKYPILLLGQSKFFFLLLPFYYLFTFPLSLLLNLADLTGKNRTGTGLLVKAYKR